MHDEIRDLPQPGRALGKGRERFMRQIAFASGQPISNLKPNATEFEQVARRAN